MNRPWPRPLLACAVVLGALPLASCPDPFPPGDAPVYTYTVLNTYPHDPAAFTQGLVFHAGRLFEGTGLFGESTLREVDLETGEVVRRIELPEQFFGEGIAIHGNTLVQLTWRSNTGFVYDLDTFEKVQEFSYPTEGWGIAYDGQRLVMSDGTDLLHFLDPASFQETGTLHVHDDGEAVTRLNELECVKGEIYANVWRSDRIARISPRTGRVLGWIDLTGILPPEDQSGSVDVLNGIAYDPGDDRLFVTGKRWPKLFEIEIRPVQEAR